jgi:Flp pilus assembly protein TadG
MRTTLNRLLGDKRGNLALSMALIAVPLIAACGIALDFATAYNKKSELQNAADAAVLFAASSGETTPEKLKGLVEKAFAANATSQFSTTPVIESVEVSEDNFITLRVKVEVPLSLARIIRPEGIDVAVVSQAVMGSSDKIEVALVLDNTFSMYGQKLADLKTASNALLDVFDKADKKRSTVRISITPFAQYVNVGTVNRNKTWLSVPEDSSTTTESCGWQTPIISQTCTTKPVWTTIDGVPYETTSRTCTNQVYGEKKWVCSTSTSTKKWNGCVGSRTTPLNVTDTHADKRYPGLQNVSCTNAITNLTNDYKVLRNAIKAMVVSPSTPFRETYIPQGVMWGWNTVNPQEPFTDALGYDEDVKKFIIVMTDGTNTVHPKDKDYSLHTEKTALTKSDQFLEEVCANAKAADADKPITVYTVAVGIAASSSTAVSLAKCATDPAKAFLADDSATLAKTFEDIAIQIMKVRLTM